MQRGTAKIALAMIALVVAVSVGVVVLSSSDDDDTPRTTTAGTTGEPMDVEFVNRQLLALPDGDRTPLELAQTIPEVGARALSPEEAEDLDIAVDEEDGGQRVVLTIVDRPLDDAIEEVEYHLELERRPAGRYTAIGLTRNITCRRGEDAQGFCL